MICFRCEDFRLRNQVVNSRRGPWDRRRYVPPPADQLCFRDWILHAVVHAELHTPLLYLGFLDARQDGDIIFWRWDFWRAHAARHLWRLRLWAWRARRGRKTPGEGCPPSF